MNLQGIEPGDCRRGCIGIFGILPPVLENRKAMEISLEHTIDTRIIKAFVGMVDGEKPKPLPASALQRLTIHQVWEHKCFEMCLLRCRALGFRV